MGERTGGAAGRPAPPLQMVSEGGGEILQDGGALQPAPGGAAEFDAVTFWERPNRNHVRLRRADMASFAASFAGAPFLRNHDENDIGAREGIVLASTVEERIHPADGAPALALRQRLRVTTERGRRALAEGQIDRFSVALDVAGWECSICGADWLACSHWPGRRYEVNGTPALCEIVAVQPRGREVSAVNVPAVDGTGLLQALCACKEDWGKELRGGREEAREEGREEGRKEATKGATKGAMEGAREEVMEGAMEGAMKEGTKGAMEGAMKDGREEGTGDGKGERMGAVAEAPLPAAPVADAATVLQALHAQLAEVQRLRAAIEAEQRERRIRASGLSEHGQQVVRLATQQGGDVLGLIEAQRSAEAALASPVKGNRALAVTGMQAPEERVQAAFDWAMGLSGAALPPPAMRNVRDLYLAITGDYDFHGRFLPEQAQLAAATTATLPGLAVNALNKVVLQYYASMLTWRWYEPLVEVVPHDGSTHDVQLIMVDGVANLATVAEGAAYTELTVGDSKEVIPFAKKGNFVGITLEMFRRSDIAKLQAIPRALMAASLRTRSAAIAGIFTAASGAGPTLADDSKALFHTDHGNLDTTAFSAAAWAAARQRIWKQAVPGTSKPLSLWPTFCLLPIDLYDTALEAFGYGTGDVGKPNSNGTAQTVNPYGGSRAGDPRPIPVVVPDWSDTNNWAYLVDPRLQPVICMAYASAPAGGLHALPEFFAGDDQRSGLLFTNDVLPVKVRDIWGFGVATYVGVGKNNVA